MPQLLAVQEQRKVYKIQKKITIGNLPGCDIQVPHVTSEEMPIQIEIEELDNGCYLRKKQGTIPLLVNGKEVEERVLVHRDTISIAEIVLLYNEADQENVLYDTQPFDADASSADMLAILSPAEREKEQLTRFYQLFSITAKTFELKELLDRLADFLLDTFHATTAMVFLKDRESAHFKPMVCKGRLQKVDWKIIEVFFSRKALYLVSKKKRSILCRGQSQKGASLLMISPLIYQGEVLGIMLVEVKEDEKDTSNSFTEKDLYVHGGIALHAANNIAHLQNYQERKQHTHRLEILNKVSLKLSSLLDAHAIYKETAKEIIKLFKCSKCSVLYLGPDDNLRIGYAVGITKEKIAKIVIPSGKGLVGWAVKYGKAVISSALPEELQPSGRAQYHSESFVIVPIFAMQRKMSKSIGAICITDRINKAAFTRHDKELLNFIAGRVGIALANAYLYEQATVDYLTQLYVRGHFLEKLEEALQQKNHPMSLLMLDIDHFKKLNDTRGHQIGDVVLQQLGDLLKKCIRDTDIPGRYGGEEFLILLKDIAYKDAWNIADRIRMEVEKFTFDVAGAALHITVSIGMTQYLDGESCDAFLLRCDQCLYQAKNSGRNRVC